ncbi:MAG TPA: cytochrome c biogenesis protein CcsA [Candidatus Acidoferrum sp.]|nr:cytochrome c biogenesis protein CcsA [Candidatus Acidoferrum sp.]
MKKVLPRLLPIVLTMVMAVWFLGQMQPHKDKGFSYSKLSKLPVVFNGRLKPMDSLARNSLLQINEMQELDLEPWKEMWQEHQTTSAIQWLANVMLNPQVADNWPVFRIDNPDLVAFLKLPDRDTAQHQDGEHYSWNQIVPSLQAFNGENARVETNVPSASRNAYENDVVKVHDRLELYAQLKNTVQPEDAQNWKQELADYEAIIPAGVAAVQAQQAGQKYNEQVLNAFAQEFNRFDYMAQLEPPLIIPPGNGDGDWKNVGTVVKEAARGKPVSPIVGYYADMAVAFQNNDTSGFNAALADVRSSLVPDFSRSLAKVNAEVFFNQMQPFYNAMVIYVLAGLLAIFSWFNLSEALRRSAIWLVALAFFIHTTGLIYRIILQGRPPVTNLYSSAIFIGWGACLLGMILEKFHKNGIGAVVSAGMGFITLIIAQNLALDGDTMEMMRAVLDTNFWLATHVVAVTTGYASTFVAGFLALIYIVRGVFTRTLDAVTAKSLARMIYGIVCFATLFSFVGTVLGGIWADQSWGRFWGWDPKENGALIIVLWNALILHLRWGGMIRERGLVNCAVFGNVVTSWSWFGVNMLGIGLHSYGFTEAAFKWLLLFVLSQLCFIVLGLLPARMWKSFSTQPKDLLPPTTDVSLSPRT